MNPPAVAQSPSLHLTIFDLDPLARALVAECGGSQEADEPLPPYARTMFAALAAVVWRLTEQPSPVAMPAGRSAEVRTALRLTEERLATLRRARTSRASSRLRPRHGRELKKASLPPPVWCTERPLEPSP